MSDSISAERRRRDELAGHIYAGLASDGSIHYFNAPSPSAEDLQMLAHEAYRRADAFFAQAAREYREP